MVFTPSMRRLIDSVAERLSDRATGQHGSVFAENGLSEELSGAPDSLVDLRTGEKCEGVAPVENTGTGKEIFKRRVVGPPK